LPPNRINVAGHADADIAGAAYYFVEFLV
jgi:hypothetical protein